MVHAALQFGMAVFGLSPARKQSIDIGVRGVSNPRFQLCTEAAA